MLAKNISLIYALLRDAGLGQVLLHRNTVRILNNGKMVR